MDIKDHAHKLALSYPGGIAALAIRMDIPYSTLKSKLNPNCDTHHMYIEDYELMLSIIDSDEGARFHAAQRDGVFVKSHQLDGVSDMELLDLFLEREEKYGKFSRSVRASLADGVIDAKEYQEMRRRYNDVSEAREQIMQRITHIYEQSCERSDRLANVRAVK